MRGLAGSKLILRIVAILRGCKVSWGLGYKVALKYLKLLLTNYTIVALFHDQKGASVLYKTTISLNDKHLRRCCR